MSCQQPPLQLLLLSRDGIVQRTHSRSWCEVRAVGMAVVMLMLMQWKGGAVSTPVHKPMEMEMESELGRQPVRSFPSSAHSSIHSFALCIVGHGQSEWRKDEEVTNLLATHFPWPHKSSSSHVPENGTLTTRRRRDNAFSFPAGVSPSVDPRLCRLPGRRAELRCQAFRAVPTGSHRWNRVPVLRLAQPPPRFLEQASMVRAFEQALASKN